MLFGVITLSRWVIRIITEQSKDKVEAFLDAGMGTKPWKLTDQYGKRRSIHDFQGQWVMLYFGFCHCPDICPEELEKLADVVKGIGECPCLVIIYTLTKH